MASILIVEDTALIRAMAADLIKKAGHSVVEVADGAEALDMLKKTGFDLVLLDIQMPEIDGYGVLLEMQKMAKPPKRLVMTGVAHSAAEVSKARTLGANGFLAKAALQEQLIFRIHQLLGLPAPA